ncbi:MAG: BrnT family toxin [Candidatus Accumulibacter sp.]|jgi:uncharacterized DUF497 family protein|nr:BrnT family toxin [Accumulibacter sp.]
MVTYSVSKLFVPRRRAEDSAGSTARRSRQRHGQFGNGITTRPSAKSISKHGIDFAGAEAIFAGFTITREDAGGNYGEKRLQTLGLWNGVVMFVSHTPRGEDDHVISIRKAMKHEERIYWQNFPG